MSNQELDDDELKELTEGAVSMGDDLDFKDDGYIELVLRVLGLMCDNQKKGLQVSFYGRRCSRNHLKKIKSKLYCNYISIR